MNIWEIMIPKNYYKGLIDDFLKTSRFTDYYACIPKQTLEGTALRQCFPRPKMGNFVLRINAPKKRPIDRVDIFVNNSLNK